MKQRDKILQEAQKLINGDRHKDYGDAYDNHLRIARMWSVILDKEITVKDVVLCMIAMKTARLIHANKLDSFVDVCGYGAIGGEFSLRSVEGEGEVSLFDKAE
tara:strand:- start:1059 stop:1367 length:309 start_codon:yes stop_codon:yes gene_type:complete